MNTDMVTFLSVHGGSDRVSMVKFSRVSIRTVRVIIFCTVSSVWLWMVRFSTGKVEGDHCEV